jgi:hypothetical protein
MPKPPDTRQTDLFRPALDFRASQGLFYGAIGATREALIAAFCRLAKSISYSEHMRWLVGAAGIEPTTSDYMIRKTSVRLSPQ